MTEKNRTLIFQIWLKSLSPLSKIWPSRIEPFWKMWLIEIELFKYDSKNWTLFFFWKRLTEPRIDFLQFDSNTWVWLKTLNLFFNITQRIEFFFYNMTHKTQRIKPFLKNDSKNLFFHDSKNLTFFLNMIQRFFCKKFLTQRIELLVLQNDS